MENKLYKDATIKDRGEQVYYTKSKKYNVENVYRFAYLGVTVMIKNLGRKEIYKRPIKRTNNNIAMMTMLQKIYLKQQRFDQIKQLFDQWYCKPGQ